MELYLSRILTVNEGPEQWIRLPKGAGGELRLGRSSDASVRLLSPHVSRNHAIVKKRVDGTFAITDQKSLNGIHINDHKLVNNTWEQMNEGDMVEIGRPDEEEALMMLGKSDRFIYIVKACPTSELDKKSPGPKQHISPLMKKIRKPPKPLAKTTEHITLDARGDTRKRPIDDPNTKLPAIGRDPSREEDHQVAANVCADGKPPKVDHVVKVFPPKNSERTEEMVQENKRLKLELEEKQQELLKEIELRNKQLEEQQTKLAEEYEKNYKNQLEQKEEELEMRLQLEKDLAFEQCHSASKKDEKPTETMKTVVDALENELQCSVCSELFILATTLNCSHTFCQFCISEWQKVKSICPVCRQPILTATRSLVLDNYIDKVLQSLSNEMKENRTKLVEERRKVVAAKNAEKARAKRGGGRARGRGRERRRQARGRGTTGTYPGVRTRSTVIVISDPESSDTSNSEDDSNSSSDDSMSSDDDPYAHLHQDWYDRW